LARKSADPASGDLQAELAAPVSADSQADSESKLAMAAAFAAPDAKLDEMARQLAGLGIRSPPAAAAAAAGVKTTEMLSAHGCQDVEQYVGVALCTVQHKDGTAHVYIMHGVFYQELPTVDPADVAALGLAFFEPDHNFAFCIFAADEFVQDVCIKGNGLVHWPRTGHYYLIPEFYQTKIALGLHTIRARPPPPSPL
jgi:hypothetical protein